MSAVLERKLDPTDGLELVTGDEVSLEAPRALFLAADLLDPARSRDIGLIGGGEELPNRCLRRTGGLLPRCSITPLEFWGEPLPLELFPDGVRPYKLKGAPDESMNFNPNGAFDSRLRGKPLFFMPLFPGELIVDALGIASGERRGVVEISVLRGVNYGAEYDALQSFFFPTDYIKPIELAKVRENIERRAAAVADPDIHSAATDMVLSCEESREYMEQVVSMGSSQLNQRVAHLHTYRLTPKLRHFMAQLGLKPRENTMEAVSDKVAEAVAQSGVSAEQLESIMGSVANVVAVATANAIKEAVAASKPAAAEVPPSE